MSITMSEYFSVSRSMQNANTAKYYFDGSILFCKIILGNWYRNIFSFFLDCGELDKHPIDYSAEDHLSRFSFSSPVSNCTSMFIDYRQCRTRSEIYWDKKREGRVFIPSRSQNSPKPHRRVIFLRAGFHFQISSVFPPPPSPPYPSFFASRIWLWYHLWMVWCNPLKAVPNNF